MILGLFIMICSCNSGNQWQERLGAVLHEFGHRNWIVIADYAYPCQSASGIETIFTGQDHLEVLSYVMEQIEHAPHISPMVLIDKELESVSEDDAPGIEDLRSTLAKQLENREVSTMPHEQIISKLDSSAKLFNVLIYKTNMTLPYTSVFIELDCGYWDTEKEKRLRDAIQEN